MEHFSVNNFTLISTGQIKKKKEEKKQRKKHLFFKKWFLKKLHHLRFKFLIPDGKAEH